MTIVKLFASRVTCTALASLFLSLSIGQTKLLAQTPKVDDEFIVGGATGANFSAKGADASRPNKANAERAIGLCGSARHFGS